MRWKPLPNGSAIFCHAAVFAYFDFAIERGAQCGQTDGGVEIGDDTSGVLAPSARLRRRDGEPEALPPRRSDATSYGSE